MSDHIVTAISQGVMTIRMNRPEKKNAITGAMYAAMAAGLDEAFQNPEVRAILILGGPGAFSSGNDIADFLQIAMTGERSSMAVFDFLERMITASKTVVAGVDGLAIGIGTTMLMHCDYVVASDSSLFKTPFVDLGLVPEAGSSLIAPMLGSHHQAFSLLAMGDGLSAEDAQRTGFVTKIVPSAELETAAFDAAQALASKPPQALELTRNLIRGDRSAILERMREEAVLFGERLESDEAKAAFTAFMSKGMKKAG